MTQVTYPMVFEKCTDESGTYYVATCPDVRGVVTDGDTISSAIIHAQEALGLILIDMETLPKASDLNKIRDEYENEYTVVNLITTDLDEIEKTSLSVVRKNGKSLALDYNSNIVAVADNDEELDDKLNKIHIVKHYVWETD